MNMDELQGLFLEECAENVDVLESGLLSMRDTGNDPDTLNAVFRAAHSIKGGGATFGFDSLSQLTHSMEAYLDALRSDQAEWTEIALGILFQAVDVLRDMLNSTDPAEHSAHPDLTTTRTALDSLLAGEKPEQAVANSTEDSKETPSHWHILFQPNEDMASRGNDPIPILRELEELGTTHTQLDMHKLPVWEQFDPTLLYLDFSIDFTGKASEADVLEVFEWVEFDCALTLSEKVDEAEAKAEPAPAPALASPVTDTNTPARKQAAKPPATDPSIRIATNKIDRIMDLVGELVITQSILSGSISSQQNDNRQGLQSNLEDLERNTRELQESVMRVRMLPISFAFGRLPRIVHDLSTRLERPVNLKFEGEATELDKTVLDHLVDPLVHLTRNAIDHGIESPDMRRDAGKSETGTILLSAHHKSGSIVITIEDDGQGIDTEKVLEIARSKGVVEPNAELSDAEIAQLIFAPGFSTAEAVTEISGRGVGMDVVKRNIIELGGKVAIHSERYKGSKVTIQLPLTLAILDGQLIQVGQQTFVVPIENIVETIELKNNMLADVVGVGKVARYREHSLPLIYLRNSLLEGSQANDSSSDHQILVVEVHGERVGLVISDVLGQQQVVIKSLEKNFRKIPGISGASIMSDGTVALILDTTIYLSSAGIKKAA
ncbi:MAG: chemotaxis protein CheA [Pseudomonadales bacterium]